MYVDQFLDFFAPLPLVDTLQMVLIEAKDTNTWKKKWSVSGYKIICCKKKTAIENQRKYLNQEMMKFGKKMHLLRWTNAKMFFKIECVYTSWSYF